MLDEEALVVVSSAGAPEWLLALKRSRTHKALAGVRPFVGPATKEALGGTLEGALVLYLAADAAANVVGASPLARHVAAAAADIVGASPLAGLVAAALA